MVNLRTFEIDNTNLGYVMRKVSFVFLSILLIMFTSCKDSFRNLEESTDNIVLVLQGETAREIFGPAPIDIADVASWTLEFTDENENTITKNNVVAQAGKLSEYVPEGTYTIAVTGTLDGVSVVGKVSNVEITTTTVVQKNVIVGFAQEGTGYLAFSFIDMNLSADDCTVSDYIIKLVPIDSESNEVIEIKSTDAAFTDETKSIEDLQDICEIPDAILSSYDSGTDFKILKINKSSIPSGDYYIHVLYKNEPLNFAYNIVQIRDNQSSEIIDYSSKSRGVKTFYITNKDSEYNGLTSDYPINIDDALIWLADNPDEWKFANLNFSTYTVSESANEYEYFASVTPKINVGLLKAAVDNTKTIKFYVDGKELGTYAYSESGKKIELELVNGYVDNLYFYTDSEKSAQTIDLSAYYDSSLNICLENTTITYYSNGNGQGTICTFISSNLATDDTACSTPIIDYTRLFSACLEMTLSVLNTNGEEVNDPLYIYKQDSSVQGGEYNEKYYTVLAGQGTVSISEKIPEFEVYGYKSVIIENNEVTYKAVKKGTETELGTGYSYEWYLNGTKVGTNKTYTLNPATNSYAVKGDNNLLVVVSKDGEIASEHIKVVFKEFLGAIFNGTSLYAVNLNDSAYKGEVSSLNKISSGFTDFAVDNKGYYYVAETKSVYSDSEGDDVYTTYVKRYKDITNTDSTEIISELNQNNGASDYKLYYDADNDIFYYAYFQTNKIYIASISDISRAEEITGIKYYDISASDFSGLYDFAVYKTNDGLLPYIVSTNDLHYNSSSGKYEGSHSKIYTTSEVLSDETNEFGRTIDLYAAEVVQKAEYKVEYDEKEKTMNDTCTLYNSLQEGSDGYDTAYSNYSAAQEAFYGFRSTYENYFSTTQQSLIIISDITVLNDKVYVLMNEVGNESYTFYSRGAVVEIDPAKGNSLSERYGYNSETALAVANSSYANNYFFGPAKFVAIKPKKLFIADDGAYKSSDGTKSPDVDRIVTFDLDTHSIVSSESISAKLNYTTEWNSSCGYYSFRPVTD